jgi:hypothetical protein
VPESDADLRELSRRVGDIERRLTQLENRFGDGPAEAPAPLEIAPSGDAAIHTLEDSTAWVPVIGRSLLGIAGAYLLRALTEHQVLPLGAGVAIGLMYAVGWLFAAARTSAGHRLAAAVNGTTAVAILAPLLWETTVRFHALTSWMAALVIILFTAFGFTVSWSRNREAIAFIAALSATAMAAVLLVATRELVPFTVALLAIAAAVEISACLDHWLRERWMVALAADLAVLLVTYVVATGRFPEGTAPISLAKVVTLECALLAIYLGSAIVRTLVRGTVFTAFESGQSAAAFLLCMDGALQASHSHPLAIALVAGVTLASSVACYLVAFAFLDRKRGGGRNFYVYSTFALLLALAGSHLVLAGWTLTLAWSALAYASIAIGQRFRRTTLQWHGMLTLLLAAAMSGLAGWSAGVLLARGAPIAAPAPVWVAACAILAACAVSVRSGLQARAWQARTCFIAMSILASVVVTATASAAMMAICRGTVGHDSAGGLCATLQTLAMSGIAAALAWSSRRWRASELAWLIVPFLMATAYKILVNDLPEGETLPLFASLLLYGGTLILVPKILQRRAG